MKKSLFVLSALLLTIYAGGQDLDNIVKKHLKAINAAKLSEFKSLMVKGSLSQQGMILDMLMYEKAPDKLKAVTTFNGMDIVQIVNGDKGIMINPMMGSTEPVNIPPDQIESIKSSSMLGSSIEKEYKAGNLETDGEGEVDGSPAYKIKVKSPVGDRTVYIDKKTYYITQISMSVSQMGTDYDVDMKMSNFETIDGVPLAKTIDTYMNGMAAGSLTYDSIQFNVSIDDSEFDIK